MKRHIVCVSVLMLAFSAILALSCEKRALPESDAAADNRQKLYTQIEAALCSGMTSLELPIDGNVCDVEGMLARIGRESVYARTMLLKYAWNLKQRNGQTMLYLNFSYTQAWGNNIRRLKQEAREIAARIVQNNIDTNYSDAEKALLLHDVLCNACRYDDAASPQSRWGYGAFVRKCVVCEGYAEAYAMLLDAAGIPCRLVSGYALADMQPHLWNLVEFDGAWHHVDVTWDDADEITVYTYFLRDDSDFSRTHRWDSSAYPAADESVSLTEIEADLQRNFVARYFERT